MLARLNGLESYLAQDEYKQEFKQIVSLAEESGLYDVLSDQEDMPVALSVSARNGKVFFVRLRALFSAVS